MRAQVVIAAVIWLALGWFTAVAIRQLGRWAMQRIRDWRWPAATVNGAHDACDLDDAERAEAAAILAREIGADVAIRDLDYDLTHRYGQQYQQPPRVEDQWGAR